MAQLTFAGEVVETAVVQRLFPVGEPILPAKALCPCCGGEASRHGLRCARCVRSGYDAGTLFAEGPA